MEHLSEHGLVLTLVFENPTSTFKFQMDEDMQNEYVNFSPQQYIQYRVQEIIQQNPNTVLKSYTTTECYRAPKKKKAQSKAQ